MMLSKAMMTFTLSSVALKPALAMDKLHKHAAKNPPRMPESSPREPNCDTRSSSLLGYSKANTMELYPILENDHIPTYKPRRDSFTQTVPTEIVDGVRSKKHPSPVPSDASSSKSDCFGEGNQMSDQKEFQDPSESDVESPEHPNIEESNGSTVFESQPGTPTSQVPVPVDVPELPETTSANNEYWREWSNAFNEIQIILKPKTTDTDDVPVAASPRSPESMSFAGHETPCDIDDIVDIPDLDDIEDPEATSEYDRRVSKRVKRADRSDFQSMFRRENTSDVEGSDYSGECEIQPVMNIPELPSHDDHENNLQFAKGTTVQLIKQLRKGGRSPGSIGRIIAMGKKKLETCRVIVSWWNDNKRNFFSLQEMKTYFRPITKDELTHYSRFERNNVLGDSINDLDTGVSYSASRDSINKNVPFETTWTQDLDKATGLRRRLAAVERLLAAETKMCHNF